MVDDTGRLAAELRDARSARRLSLRGASAKAEISATYLQKLERGLVAKPSPTVLQGLAGALGISYRRLMELAGYTAPPTNARSVTGVQQRMASVSLTEVEERSVLAFIDHLVSHRRDS
jgi:transcriptional regulator with XRE-family HTH domain